MDALKQQLLKVQQQLAGLSASQKMLTASLLVIMVMTLFYWSHFAASTEMEVVATPAAGEVEGVKKALDGRGIKYEMQGDRVLVAGSSKLDAQAALSFNTALPAPTDKVFEDAINASNFWETPSARADRMMIAKQQWLAKVMSRWAGVTGADVLLSGEKKAAVVQTADATATVNMTLGAGAGDQRQIAEAARLFVVRSQAGLEGKNVAVIINGRPFKADDADNPFGGITDQLAAQSTTNKYYESQLTNLLGITGLRVTVAVKMSNETSDTTEHTLDPKQHLEQLQHSQNSTEENAAPPPGGEPGVNANVGLPDTTPATASAGSSKDLNELTNGIDHATKDVKTHRPAGSATPQSASIGIPDSYLRRCWREWNKSGEPTEDAIVKILEDQKPNISDAAVKTCMLASNATVAITRIHDFAEPAPADAAASAALASIPVGVGFGAKEMAVGALAVLSLFMVMMMVRKSAPQPLLATAGPDADTHETPSDLHGSMLTVNEMVGEVGEGTNTLVGHELSEEQLESKQVIEQVGTMVKSNPDTAATLVKRWLNQD